MRLPSFSDTRSAAGLGFELDGVARSSAAAVRGQFNAGLGVGNAGRGVLQPPADDPAGGPAAGSQSSLGGTHGVLRALLQQRLGGGGGSPARPPQSRETQALQRLLLGG